LNRQKPIGRAVSAWWPGGRAATKALAAFWFITSSTARMAPPAPRSAASKLPADIVVSASRPHHAFASAGEACGSIDVIHRMAERDDLERRARRLFAR